MTKNKKPIRVLMTGGGAPGAAGILKCLKMRDDLEIIVGDASRLSSGAKLHHDFVLLPHASDKNFIEIMLKLCQKKAVDVIFPLVTKELPLFASAKNLFAEINTSIIVSDEKSLMLANDKLALYETLAPTAKDIPAFEIVTNGNMISAAAEKLGFPERPVVFKLAVSNGSRGIRIIDNKFDRLNGLLYEKPNTLFISMEEILKIVGDQNIPRAMICEYLPHEEITVDTICSNGRMLLCLIRTRDKINSGISQAGRFINHPSIETSTASIIKKLNLDGPIGFQYKQSNEGDFKLLEINPRIQGTSVSSLGLGINLPSLAIDNLFGVDMTPAKKKSGIGFIRYFEEVYFDV